MKNRNFSFWLYSFLLVVIGGLIGLILSFSPGKSRLSFSENQNKLMNLVEHIEADYVDSIDIDSLMDDTVRDILGNLDPHSTYIAREDLERANENIMGSFEGIGVEFIMYRDSILVLRTFKNGPSDGFIERGDRILRADGVDIFGKDLGSDEIVKRIKGPKGSKVEIEIYRPITKEFKSNKIERRKVEINSTSAGYMLTDEIGYIGIKRFSFNTDSELKTRLLDLKEKGVKKIIVDLRNNSGGLLKSAYNIVDEFLEKDQMIVYTQGKNTGRENFYATAKGDFESGQVYIIINENSASASEILAGALQDNDKGTIIGRRSFGKGLVQQEMNLSDGSAIRLTISRFYTPLGRFIQKPYGENKGDYYNDYVDRFYSGELYHEDSIKTDSEQKFRTKKGKIVYGGGGIIPDIFVPRDSVSDRLFSRKISFARVYNFALDYADSNRNKILKIGKEGFKKQYDISHIYSKLLDSLKTKSQLNRREKSILQNQLRANMARIIWDEETFIEILNNQDLVIKKILELEDGDI